MLKFRHMNLCNVSYKIIVNFFANKLKEVLDMIISLNELRLCLAVITDNARLKV